MDVRFVLVDVCCTMGNVGVMLGGLSRERECAAMGADMSMMAVALFWKGACHICRRQGMAIYDHMQCLVNNRLAVLLLENMVLFRRFLC